MEDAKRPQGRASGMMRVKKWQDCHGRRKAPARASIRDDASQKMAGLPWKTQSARKGEHQG